MFGGQLWAPAAYTAPLSDRPVSDGPRLVELVERIWRTPDGARLRLDDWQKELLIALLERYPDDYPDGALAGRLRYRQAVVSVARQNGKSLLGGILGLYGLLWHVPGPLVIGVASTREQADIVYNRTRYVVSNTPAIAKRIKGTGTRGLQYRDGSGKYEVKASKADALQGLAVTLGICDELHILEPGVWDSLVTGQRAQDDGLLVGITTAGDDQSHLLKRLYKRGHEAVSEDASRFGFFLWEAPEGSTIDTPGALEAASPAVACGRLPPDRVREDVRNLPVVDQERYTLNRFVSAVSSWLPTATWVACKGPGIPPGTRDVVFSLEKTSGWEHASVIATARVGTRLHTQLIATIESPSLDRLESVCRELAGKYQATFAMGTYSLGNLGNRLKDRGYAVWKLSPGEVSQACSTGYAKINSRSVSHTDSALIKAQLPLSRRKSSGTGWTLQPTDTALGIDALLATLYGLHVAETKRPSTPQLFI